MNLEVKTSDKRTIVQACIVDVNRQIYNHTINAEVGKIAEDETMQNNSKEALKRLLKVKKAYEVVLEKLEKEDGHDKETVKK